MNRRALYWIAIVLILGLAACSGGGGSSNSSLQSTTFEEDPSIFTKSPDSSVVLEHDAGGGEILKLPVTMILFMFDGTITPEAAETTIESFGGKMVGQIPDLDIIQGEFSNLTTLTELDAKIDEIIAAAPSGLLASTYDAYPDPFIDEETRASGSDEVSLTPASEPTMDKCSVFDDNMWLDLNIRCPLENADYYNLSVIMEELTRFQHRRYPLQRLF